MDIVSSLYFLSALHVTYLGGRSESNFKKKKTGCQAGATCAGSGQCQRLSLSTSRSTSTFTSRSTSTSRATITTRSLSISTSTRTRTTAKTKTTEKCSGPTGGVARRATGGNGYEYIKVEGEANCVPVLDFFCVPDLQDQMCMSMCQGIRDQQMLGTSNVLSDTAILLHRRMGRNAAAGCGTMGCARTFSLCLFLSLSLLPLCPPSW